MSLFKIKVVAKNCEQKVEHMSSNVYSVHPTAGNIVRAIQDAGNSTLKEMGEVNCEEVTATVIEYEEKTP